MNREILRLAIPNILSNMAVPLLSAVDTALVGHIEGLHYLGAVALGTMIFNFIYWAMGFLRMGTTGLTAQAFGETDHKQSALVLGRALTVGLSTAALLMLLQYPLADISFYFLATSPEVEKFARSYFHIRILAAPATLSLYALHGWFLGMQNARYPLYLSVFTNVVNIFFSLYFVKVLQLNSDGVAWGTVAAQYCGLIFAGFLFLLSYRRFTIYFKLRQIFDREALKRFIDVNRDIFIRTLCLVFAFTFFTAKSAEMGDEILAANTILMQLWTIMAYGIDGFAFAAESLVGRFIGAKDASRLRKVVKLSFYWALGLGAIFSVIYGLLPEEILQLFTNKPDLVALSMTFVGWTIIAPLINGFCFIWDGIFIGATDGRPLRNSMMFCTFVIFLPIYFLLREPFGNHGLWLAMIIFMLFRGLTLSWMAYRRMHLWTASSTKP